MVSSMRFERKKPPRKRKKAAYAAVKTELDGIAQDINALRLALWYAEYKRDFHTLSPKEIKQRLAELSRRIDAVDKRHLSDPDSL